MRVLSNSNFEKNISNHNLSIVSFTSKYCPSCTSLEKNINLFEGKLQSNKLSFFEVDVDDEPLLEDKFDIDFFPTIILFSKGKEIGRTEGRKSLREIKDFIFENLKKEISNNE